MVTDYEYCRCRCRCCSLLRICCCARFGGDVVATEGLGIAAVLGGEYYLIKFAQSWAVAGYCTVHIVAAAVVFVAVTAAVVEDNSMIVGGYSLMA